MDNGWIKLYRCLLDKAIWKCSTPEQRCVLIAILLMANHEPKQWIWQGRKYEVGPGQLITSLNHLALKADVSVQNVRSALKKFEKLDFLTNEPTSTGRLITIVNWGIYQPQSDEPNKEPNKEVTKSQQRGNKEPTTNKNDKNDKNDKNINNKVRYSDDDSLNDAIKDFIEHRRKLRKPMTDKAIELLISKLNKLAPGNVSEKVELINTAIEKGWLSVYPSKKESELPKDVNKLKELEDLYLYE